uniref:Uncharacterized protein n=1 Tax=Rhizophagus irregularis (strain DAOM 181602 / DAOM 197198 / MUCL 43194) TaxID=747089 RepID=U9T9G6_RHIID
MILQTFLQILEKNTLTKIAKLEKQLKLLKEQTSKDNKKQNSEKQKTFEAVEQSDEKPKQSSIKEICKHKINYGREGCFEDGISASKRKIFFSTSFVLFSLYFRRLFNSLRGVGVHSDLLMWTAGP